MKFLIDENVTSSVLVLLRKEGFDVKDVKEEKLYGLKDGELFRMAISENRILVTHDKDFANLYFMTKKKQEGIILLRFRRIKAQLIEAVLLSFLHSELKEKIQGNLVILTEDKVIIQTASEKKVF